MGNILSSCFPPKEKDPDYSDFNNNTPIGNRTSGGGRKTSGGRTLEGNGGKASGGQALGGDKTSGKGGPSRESMAAAAQERQEKAKLKGVQKGGGKLTKQLEDQQKKSNQLNQPDSTPSSLQWRVD